MSEIIVNKKEIIFLENELKLKLIEDLVYKDLLDINWNSNTENYKVLIDTISDNTKSKKKIGATFLRDLFYKKEEFRQVREKNINLIYDYLYKKNRNIFLNENNITFDSKKYYLYSVKILTDEQKKTVKDENKLDITFLTFEDEPNSIIISQYKNSKTGVCFFIDQNFLQEYRSMKFLIDLFTESFISLIINFNVKFIFDNNIDEDEKFNLNSNENRNIVFEFWEKKKESIKNESFRNKIEEIPFMTILENLKRFSDESDIQEKTSIDNFLPLLKKLNKGLRYEPLKNIYKSSENDNSGKDYNILGVIGYDGYFNNKEKNEMLKYFYYFSETLKNSNIIRIFTIPSKKIKGKGWRSQLDSDINNLLYQYIYMNLTSNVETYILTYDDNEITDADTGIMWHQDYVLRIEKTKDDKGNLADSLFKTHNKRDVADDEKTELYFAYPEDENEVNQMLKLNYNNKLYIKKMFNDFINRISLNRIEKKYAHIQRVELNNTDILKNILNMNTSNSELFKILELDVNLFYENN